MAATPAALRSDSREGPAAGLLAPLLLLAVLAATAGLGAAAWGVGVACAVVLAAALARGLARRAGAPLSPASRITLGRATLAVGVAALVAQSFSAAIPRALLVALAAVALAMDLADGRLARRTGTVSAFGARFDGEVDAFLILVLSVFAARSVGAWVLAIGAARYGFLAGEALAPWMRASLPPRRWRKLVAAAQGIVLTVAAAGVLPRSLVQVLLAAALAALAVSMGECVWWLRRRRPARPARPAHGTARAGLAVALTGLALLAVWAALVVPDTPRRLAAGTFARLPLELLVVVALAVLLPAAARRALVAVLGAMLGVLVLVKVLDWGFYTAYDRRFDPINDWSYATVGVETLQETIGTWRANAVVAGVVGAGLVLVTGSILALLRVTRVAARHRGRALSGAAALAGAWLVLHALGAPAASTGATTLALYEAQRVQTGLRDGQVFARAIAHDRFRSTPADRLLTGLRGKDVLLLFVESYGRVAVQGSSSSPRIGALLDRGTAQLGREGFAARSAFLTSPTFGGISWLAHATLQAGVRVDGQRRYNQLHRSGRFTLSRAFARAGWRTVADLPENKRAWPEGSAFYRFQRIYDRRTLGYRGPRLGLPTMPDQYALAALQRRELARRDRPPVFAEVDFVSSHAPWTRIPRLIPWDDVGDGAVYRRLPLARPGYGPSIEYTLKTIVSFVRRYGDDDLVLVVLGDHQPATNVSGQDAGHDVPVTVVAHDPEVLHRIAGWGWDGGLRPGPRAPVWPMSAFRDRFLTAFGPSPAAPDPRP